MLQCSPPAPEFFFTDHTRTSRYKTITGTKHNSNIDQLCDAQTVTIFIDLWIENELKCYHNILITCTLHLV